MTRKPSFAVIVVSVILLVYCVLIGFHIFLPVAYLIFATSPFLLIWLVYTIIRHGAYDGRELRADEEWGYQDQSKSELDVF
jgi:hypothetical protein